MKKLKKTIVITFITGFLLAVSYWIMDSRGITQNDQLFPMITLLISEALLILTLFLLIQCLRNYEQDDSLSFIIPASCLNIGVLAWVVNFF